MQKVAKIFPKFKRLTILSRKLLLLEILCSHIMMTMEY